MNLRISQMPTIASSAITMTFAIMLANAPPRPKCDSSAAMPRPAARPAIGPSQRERFGCAAGAGAAGLVRCAGAACCIGCLGGRRGLTLRDGGALAADAAPAAHAPRLGVERCERAGREQADHQQRADPSSPRLRRLATVEQRTRLGHQLLQM
jgi:hypothetical protein